MDRTLMSVAACAALFLGMMMVSSLCYRFGRRRLKKEDVIPEVSGAIIGSIFALLGLLLSFTFFGAYARFDARRTLIVEEANAIGTAYLRLDLLPAETQPALRETFREYTECRAAMYEKLPDSSAASSELARAAALQKEIWAQAVAATSGPKDQPTRVLLLPALNDMIDIVTTRATAIRAHPPLPVFILLFAIALACAGLTGYRASASEHPGHVYNVLLALVTASVLLLILDIEYPRHGLIRLDKVNHVLTELRQTMGP